MTSERARRLFFALWPDEALRDRIAEATAAQVRAAGGRPVPRASWHVTVAFLGQVAEARLPCVRAAGGAARGVVFDLALLRIEHWPRARVLSLRPAESPADLGALVARLWQALGLCGFEPETRPFAAHLTLARDAQAPRGVALDVGPLEWRVLELSLMESITDPRGARYERLQTWPLTHANLGAAAPVRTL